MENTKKVARYDRLYQQIKELLAGHTNTISKMATIVAVLNNKMECYFWTGFYMLNNGDLLVGPYQGPVACIKLKKDTGVCWAGINQQKSIVVSDVEKFPGHIACDSRSKSEIVVPLKNEYNEIIGVLDVDSSELNSFDETDRNYLEKILYLIFNS